MGDYFHSLPKFVVEFIESKKEMDAIPFIYSVRKDKTLEQFEKNKIISAFIISRMNDIGRFRRKCYEFSWQYVDVECGSHAGFAFKFKPALVTVHHDVA